MRDEPAQARQFAQQCVEFSSQFGFPEFIGMGRIVRGWAEARLGNPAQGLEDLEAGVAMWQMTGFENWQSWFACLKADVLHLLNRQKQAREEIDTQLARIAANGELQFREQLLSRAAAMVA
jgi:hypothetical protein